MLEKLRVSFDIPIIILEYSIFQNLQAEYAQWVSLLGDLAYVQL